MQLFKQTQQQQRPPWKKREDTIKLFKEKLKVDHYETGHDARGMLDLSPDVLGVGYDKIRSKLFEWGDGQMASIGHPNQYRSQQPARGTTRSMKVLDESQGPNDKHISLLGRPIKVPENPAVDWFIRRSEERRVGKECPV